jgi:hypothetical protein
MSVLTPVANEAPQPRRFTVDEYHRMAQTGILTEDDPVELLEGLIVRKMTRNPPHDIALELADDAIRPWLPAGWRIRIQSAITTVDSEPEPDLVLVRGPIRNRPGRHPSPQELALVVEVADTSLAVDRGQKADIYARAGIVCYWILNLIDAQIEVYTDPSGPDARPTFRQRRDYGSTDAVPLVIDGREIARIAVSEFLP